MIDLIILEQHLRDACVGHGKIYEDGMLRMWIGCTASITTEQFQETFWGCAANGVPKPADLLKAVAGVNPRDDWEGIMGVAQGRYENCEISGQAAIALRSIGGIRAVAMAKTEGTYSESDRLKKEFFDNLQIGSGGLPPAREVISLSGSPRQTMPVDTFIDSHGKSCRTDYCDASGKDRADSLCRLLRSGELKPKTVRLILSGKSGAPGGRLPAAQRDRVLAAIGEVEINNYKEKYHEQSIQKNGQRRIGQYR
jgi:hypothetical protein